MKTKLFMLLLGVSAVAFCACDDDNDNARNVSQEYKTALYSMYPEATRVGWEQKGQYYVADFWRSGMNADAEAWFDGGAKWQITVTEIGYDALPKAVKDAFTASEYGTLRVDDVDMVERVDLETIYIIDVDGANDQDYDLYYTADGTLVKAVPDTDGYRDASNYIPGTISSTDITEYISTNYPDARIVEIENEHGKIEVDIVDGRVPRELIFTTAGEWLSTKTEIRAADAPQVVKDALSNSEYASYRIDDVDWYLTPDAEFYICELEAEPDDIKVKISAAGTVEGVYRD